jgi:hypothetical protein
MANTYDSDLVVDRLADQAILVLQNRLAPQNAFSRDFGVDVLRPRATVQVEKSGTHAAAQQNPTNYETGDSTNSNVAVTVNEESVSFHVTSQELMQGHKLETKAANHLHGLADAIAEINNALLTTAAFGAAVATTAQASMAAADLQAGWADIAKSGERHVVLDAVAFSKFLPTNRDSFTPGSGAYGYDGFHLQTNWDSVGTAGVKGFFCGPNAIACAAGLPEISQAVQNKLEATRVIQLPDLGLAIQMCLWGSTTSRATWVSYGLMYGAAVGDADALGLYIPA